MNADPDLLLDLAGSVSDGTPVDWSAASATPQAGSMRDVIEEMALLARIGELHRTFATTTGSGELTAPVDPDHTQLARWGDLILVERVGAGTAGEVFRAYDDQLQREVALKLFYPDPDATSTPLIEGRLLARVRHPNVVTVFGAAESGGRIGLWMEFIRGRTLGARVADEGPLSVREVVDMGIELCEALAAVHQAGLLHRDVKPQNVMLSHDGRVVLMDFSAGREQLDADQTVAGTPLYLAPELFRGGSPSVESDLYSLGVLLFHLLTGSYPVTGRNVGELRRAHEAPVTRSLASVRPDLSAAVATAIERAISPSPSDRFGSAADMARSLRAALPAEVESGRWRRLASLVIAVGLGVGAVGATAVWVTGGFVRSGDGPANPSPMGTVAGLSVHAFDSKEYLPIGAPSPDGLWLPVRTLDGALTADGPSVILVDARTGRRREMASTPADNERTGRANKLVFSPDSRLLAYSWLPNASGASRDLRILDVATMATEVVHQNFNPVGWTSDARRLVVFQPKNGELAYLDIATRGLQAIGEMDTRSSSVSLSPDGRYVVFDRPAPTGSAERDVFIADLTDWRVGPLVEHPSMDAMPVWLPDASGVVFASDRAGSLGLWKIAVAGGQPVGAPVLVRPRIGKYQPLGFDGSGDLYYWVSGPIEVYTADVDLGRGGVTGVNASVSVVGDNSFSDWSPDGRELVYVSRLGEVLQSLGSDAIVIRDVESNRGRVIPTAMTIGNPRWSPDGQQVILPADGPAGPGDYLLTLADDRIEPLLLGKTRPRFPSWMPDGRTLLFLAPGTSNIHALDMATRATRPLVADAGKFVISHRGDRILFVTTRGEGAAVVWHAETNTRLELARPADGFRFLYDVVGWSPDDAEVVLSVRVRSHPDLVTDLIAFPSGGGTARLVGRIPGEWARNVRLNPAGTRISFEAGLGANTAWVMRGLLTTHKGQ